MPVERGPKIDLRNALILGVSGVFIAGALFVFVTWMAGTGGVEVQLGDDVFEAGGTERIAAEIDDRGPILYSDVAGGTRDLYVNHLSDDPAEGWVAFAAQQPGAARECFLVWQPADAGGAAGREAAEAGEEAGGVSTDGVFVDQCDGAEFPPDGAGLPQYAVFVEDDGQTLVVDLNGVRTTTTTGPPTPEFTAP